MERLNKFNLMSLDNDIDELFKKLNAKKEVIDKMAEGKEKEREKRILQERLEYLQKYFPSSYKSCSYALTKNLQAKREQDHKVIKKDNQTIFVGLNLRSSDYCGNYYFHNYPLGEGIYILDDYYKRYYSCQICGKQFCFDKYFTFWQCYYSVNNEPEKSTGEPDNVVKFSIIPGEKKEINIRHHEKFNIIIKGQKIGEFNFSTKLKVREFKKYIEETLNDQFIVKDVYFFRMYEKKKLEIFESLDFVTGREFDVELVIDDKTFNKFELKEKFKLIIEQKK